MTNNDVQIVIVDDDIAETHPVVIFLKRDFPHLEIIRTIDAGVNYVRENLDKNLILILDYRFGNNRIGGYDALKEIREISEIVPVILFTAENIKDKLKEFVELKVLAFANKGDYEDVASKVEEAKQKMSPLLNKAEDEWEMGVVGILEDYIKIREKDRRNKPYLLAIKDKEYSLEELLSKVKKDTEFSEWFNKRLHQLAIKQLMPEGIALESILIIDDKLEKTEPFIFKLEKKYPKVVLKNTPQGGVDYVQNNLDEIMIIILDYRFAPGDPNGSWVIKKIREFSKIIPIIILTAQQKNIEEFGDFINNNTFSFANQGDYEDILNKVEEAKEYWQTITTGAYTEWIFSKSEAQREKPYLAMADNKRFSLNELKNEAMKKSNIGQTVIKDINMATMDLLLRKKISIND